ncbi:hypothetical protein LCGC14_2068520 [marine sediment metagenome]|uniref:YkgJ family cysteine cluster protein n=1 Tax=marine sediment metagenome TaxID=412755 RepID=A0A0F9F6G0_9ZZZZ
MAELTRKDPDIQQVTMDMSNDKCKRCGRCCTHVGRTFWRNADLTDPVLIERAENTESSDGATPCEMLLIKNGFGTCLIDDQKPRECREYPENTDTGLCFLEIDMAGCADKKGLSDPA